MSDKSSDWPVVVMVIAMMIFCTPFGWIALAIIGASFSCPSH